MKLTTGQHVRIDADVDDWGRVVGTATVAEDYGDGFVQVDADEIRATITVRRREVFTDA